MSKFETLHNTSKLREKRGDLVVVGPGREYYWGRGASSRKVEPAQRGPSTRSLVTAVGVGVMACELAEYRKVIPIVAGNDRAGFPDFALTAIEDRFPELRPIAKRNCANTRTTGVEVAALLHDMRKDVVEVAVCSDEPQGHNLATELSRRGVTVTGIIVASSVVLGSELLLPGDPVRTAAQLVVDDPWAPLEACKQVAAGFLSKVDRHGFVIDTLTLPFRPPVDRPEARG